MNQAYNTDCLTFLAEYTGRKIDLVVTDPPYALDHSGGGGFVSQQKMKNWKKQLYTPTLAQSYDIPLFDDLLDKVQHSINAYFFCNKTQIPEYIDEYVRKRKCKFDILCWHKTNPMPLFKCKYLTDTEFILYFRAKGHCDPQCYQDARTYFLQQLNSKDKTKYNHPTIKPMNIIRTLIRNSSKQGDLVFDGFLGSGTTRIAAAIENRDFIGCEINPQYFEMQQDRFQQYLNNTTL